jgi:hypothetical protein
VTARVTPGECVAAYLDSMDRGGDQHKALDQLDEDSVDGRNIG